jgi:hypothetical protein
LKVPRVLVTRDDGQVFWNESVKAVDFDADHFRRCLADRLGWAVADAEGPAAANVRQRPPAPDLGGDILAELTPAEELAA